MGAGRLVSNTAREATMITIGYRLRGCRYELEQALLEARGQHLAKLGLALDGALIDIARAQREIDGR